MLHAIKGRQWAGRPALLSRQRIAELASMSLRSVERLENELARRGFLRVTPVARRGRGGRILRLYEVMRVQGDLFEASDDGKTRSGIVEMAPRAPGRRGHVAVQFAVENR